MKEQRKGKGGAARTTRDRWSENRGHWPVEFQRAAKKCQHDLDCFRYANPGDAMANTHPDHSKWIIGIKDRPCINERTLSSGSKEMATWQCQYCREHFTRVVRNTTKYTVVACSTCLNNGTSRLEFQIASLINLYTGMAPTLQHVVGKNPPVDLYLEDLDTAVQIDPHYFHREPSRFESDERVTGRLHSAYTQVLRLRDVRLPEIGGTIPAPANFDAFTGARLIALALGFTTPKGAPTEIERDAKRLGDIAYDARQASPPSNPLSEHPAIRVYVRNLSRPGRSPSMVAVTESDDCEWRCANANLGHQNYRATVRNRAGAERVVPSCPICAAENRRLLRRTPEPGRSLADVRPEVAAEFVRNLTEPTHDPTMMNPGTEDRCIWRCSIPGCRRGPGGTPKVWEASTDSRRTPGCSHCNRSRATIASIPSRSEKTRTPKPGQSFADLHPIPASELVEVIDHPDRDATSVNPSTSAVGRWKCHFDCKNNDGGPFYEMKISQRKRRDTLGCTTCSKKNSWRERAKLGIAPPKWVKTPEAGESFAERNPVAASEAVSNLDNPGRMPDSCSRGTNDRMMFRCEPCATSRTGQECTECVIDPDHGPGMYVVSVKLRAQRMSPHCGNCSRKLVPRAKRKKST